jgi:hypothetical protein
MAALTASRMTMTRDGERVSVVASGTGYQGGMVALDADGLGVAASPIATQPTIGIAHKDFVDGDRVDVAKLCAAMSNSADADLIAKANIGQVCYVVDDGTVALTSNSGARPIAGQIVDVDEYGVWVDFDDAPVLGRTMTVQATVETLVGANVYRTIAPVDGRIVKIWSVTEGVLTTGDATLTAKIGATAITGGVLTITQAGSAAGDIDSATPTAANAVAAGAGLSVTVGGTNATATKARVLFVIAY